MNMKAPIIAQITAWDTAPVAQLGGPLARSFRTEPEVPRAGGPEVCTTSEQLQATAVLINRGTLVGKGWLGIYADLFKARLTSLVLLTTMVGFYLGFRGPVDYGLLCRTLLGTALLAGGAAALNQFLEREYDAKMRRTQDRPLPSGCLQPQTVLIVGCVTAVLGVVCLAQAVNLTTSLVGTLSLVCYLFVYTPLKRVTWLNTLVGAVPGALPPLMGWTAARGELSREGLALFAIQACWQLPHFMAIAWIYREEYAHAGFQMLPVVDPQGRRTGRQALAYALALLVVSVCPFWFQLTGPIYLASALVFGLLFVWFAFRFARTTWLVRTRSIASHFPAKTPGARGNASLPQELNIVRARQLFYASLVYLPLLLAVMVLDKIK
jgi:heme o synthase